MAAPGGTVPVGDVEEDASQLLFPKGLYGHPQSVLFLDLVMMGQKSKFHSSHENRRCSFIHKEHKTS